MYAAGCWRTRLRPVRTWTRARLAAGARASSCRQRDRWHSWKNATQRDTGLREVRVDNCGPARGQPLAELARRMVAVAQPRPRHRVFSSRAHLASVRGECCTGVGEGLWAHSGTKSCAEPRASSSARRRAYLAPTTRGRRQTTIRLQLELDLPAPGNFYVNLPPLFLGHFSPVFSPFVPRFYAVLPILPPRFRKPAPRPGKTVRNGRKRRVKTPKLT